MLSGVTSTPSPAARRWRTSRAARDNSTTGMAILRAISRLPRRRQHHTERWGFAEGQSHGQGANSGLMRCGQFRGGGKVTATKSGRWKGDSHQIWRIQVAVAILVIVSSVFHEAES